jgi:hypothetical protein
MQLTSENMKSLIVAAKTVARDEGLTQTMWETAVTAISRGVAELKGILGGQPQLLSQTMDRLSQCWDGGKLKLEQAQALLDAVLVWLIEPKVEEQDLGDAERIITDMHRQLCPPTA